MYDTEGEMYLYIISGPWNCRTSGNKIEIARAPPRSLKLPYFREHNRDCMVFSPVAETVLLQVGQFQKFGENEAISISKKIENVVFQNFEICRQQAEIEV